MRTPNNPALVMVAAGAALFILAACDLPMGPVSPTEPMGPVSPTEPMGPVSPTEPARPPIPPCSPVTVPPATAGVDFSGILRNVETGQPARGVVLAYDASWTLLDESIACDDGRFALTVPDASVTEITLQGALSTRNDHAYVRTVKVPARDDFNLKIKAISFSGLRTCDPHVPPYCSDSLGWTPPDVFLQEMSNYNFGRAATGSGGRLTPYDVAAFRGLIVLRKSLNPDDKAEFTTAEQSHIARRFRELAKHVPGLSAQVMKGSVIVAGENYVLPESDKCPDGHPNCAGWNKKGWIIVEPKSTFGSTAWSEDLDGDLMVEAGSVSLHVSLDGEWSYDGTDKDYGRESTISHEFGHVIMPSGHPRKSYVHRSVMTYGPGQEGLGRCEDLCHDDLKAIAIIYGYPVGSYREDVMRLNFGPQNLSFAGQTIEDHTFTVGINPNTIIVCPIATSDSPPITYTIGPVIPPGMMSYSPGALSVTDAPQVSGTWNMVCTATDAAGRTASLRYVITVEAAGKLRFVWQTVVAEDEHEIGEFATISLDHLRSHGRGIKLPLATSDSRPITYALGPVMPPGWVFDEFISFNFVSGGGPGSQVVAGNWNMEYTATDAAGRTATLRFTITVNP